MKELELLDRLIKHYQALPGLDGWSELSCAGGTLRQWGVLPDGWGTTKLGSVLGLNTWETNSLFYGFLGKDIQHKLGASAERRDYVVNLLINLHQKVAERNLHEPRADS